MKIISLKELATVTAGQSAPKPELFSNEGLPFVRAGSLEELIAGKKESDLELISNDVAKKLRLNLYPAGSILFAKSGISATKNRFYQLKTPAYVVSHLAILIPKDCDFADYFRHVLIKYPPSSLIKDLAYPAISLGDIQDFKVPIPETSDDQIRIATLLSKVEKLIFCRREQLKQLDELVKSVFLEMFGDPVRNEKGWDTVLFSSILKDIESGWSPVCEARKASSSEWGVLKLGAITSCVFKDDENKALLPDVQPKTKNEVQAGDLLFSRKNTYDLVAACVYVFNTRSKLMLSDLIFRFVFNDDSAVTPLYIWKLIINASQRKKIQSLAGGAAGSMPNISKANLRNIQIPLPPLDLQNRFSDIVIKVETLKAQYTKFLTNLEAVYGTLSQKAFKGELDLSQVPLVEEE